MGRRREGSRKRVRVTGCGTQGKYTDEFDVMVTIEGRFSSFRKTTRPGSRSSVEIVGKDVRQSIVQETDMRLKEGVGAMSIS